MTSIGVIISCLRCQLNKSNFVNHKTLHSQAYFQGHCEDKNGVVSSFTLALANLEKTETYFDTKMYEYKNQVTIT